MCEMPLTTGVPDEVAAAQNESSEYGPPAPDDLLTGNPDEVAAARKEGATEEKKSREELAKEGLEKMSPEEREVAERKAREVASQLSTEISKTHLFGNNTDVTNHLRGLSPAEMQLVMDSYKEQSKSAFGTEADLAADLRDKLDGKDLAVAEAAMSGDKIATAKALVEQATDGVGTDTQGMKEAMEMLETPEERKKFHELMGEGEYEKLVKDETSSFDRDKLMALGLEDQKQRDAAVAVSDVSENAYGGKYNAIVEGITDSAGDLMGTPDEQRAQGRAAMRDYDMFKRFSNLGGNEDAQLDATEKIAGDPETLKLFKERMAAANGESAEETLTGEMSEHRAEAAKKLLEGNVEDAQAHRMVAHLDNYVDDNENGASQVLEGKDKATRDRLVAKADALAKQDGNGSYQELLDENLSPAELEVAKQRREKGKADELAHLMVAGDTTVGGLGKDTAKFYETMQDKTPAQMDKMRKDFETSYPGEKFDDWVRSKATSDGERRDFEIMLEGNYGNMSDEELKKLPPEKMIQRVKDLNEAGRGGAEDRVGDPLGNIKREVGNDVGNYMGDTMSNAGDRMNARMAAVEDLEKKIAAGEQLTPEQHEELVQHMRFMSGDQKAFTETKTEVVNQTAEVVGTAANVATTAVTGSDTAGEVVGGLAKMEVKGTLNASRYSTDEMIADGADVVGSAAGGALASKAPGAGFLIEGATDGIAQTVGDTKNWNDAGRAVASGAQNVTESVVSAAAGEGIEGAMGDGIASKVTQAVADTAVTSDYSQSFGEMAKETAKNAAIDIAVGAASKHHSKRNPSSSSSSTTTHTNDSTTTPTTPSTTPSTTPATPSIEARAPTPRVQREIIEAVRANEGDEAARKALELTRRPPAPAEGPDIESREATPTEKREIMEAVIDPLSPLPVAPDPAIPPPVVFTDEKHPRDGAELPDLSPPSLDKLVQEGRDKQQERERLDAQDLKGMRTPYQDAVDHVFNGVKNGKTGISTLDSVSKVFHGISELGKADPDSKKVRTAGQEVLTAFVKLGTNALPPDLKKFVDDAVKETLQRWNAKDPEALGTKKLISRPPEKVELMKHEEAIKRHKKALEAEGKAAGEKMPDYEIEVEARKRVLDEIQDKPQTLDDAMEGARVDEDAPLSLEHLPPEKDVIDRPTPGQQAKADARERERTQRASLQTLIDLCEPEDLFAKRDLEKKLRQLDGPSTEMNERDDEKAQQIEADAEAAERPARLPLDRVRIDTTEAEAERRKRESDDQAETETEAERQERESDEQAEALAEDEAARTEQRARKRNAS